MGLIRHWTYTTELSAAPGRIVVRVKPQEGNPNDDVTAEVEYAPLTDTPGAVDALDEAVKAARLFNRSGMTWLEYDRLLVRLEGVVNQARGQ